MVVVVAVVVPVLVVVVVVVPVLMVVVVVVLVVFVVIVVVVVAIDFAVFVTMMYILNFWNPFLQFCGPLVYIAELCLLMYQLNVAR